MEEEEVDTTLQVVVEAEVDTTPLEVEEGVRQATVEEVGAEVTLAGEVAEITIPQEEAEDVLEGTVEEAVGTQEAVAAAAEDMEVEVTQAVVVVDMEAVGVAAQLAGVVKEAGPILLLRVLHLLLHTQALGE